MNVQLELADDLPRVMADPEAIKRVVANLVDNAAESMKDSVVREIRIATSLLETRDAVEIEVSDTGEGVTAEDEGEAVSALLLHQGARDGPGTGHCGANSGRSRRHGAGRGESSGGHALPGGAARG